MYSPHGVGVRNNYNSLVLISFHGQGNRDSGKQTPSTENKYYLHGYAEKKNNV